MLQGLHRAVRVVVNAHHIFVIIVVAALAESLSNRKLVADTHIHQAIHRIFIQELHNGFFQNIEVGHCLIQRVSGIKNLPGDNIGKVWDPLSLLKVGGIPEQLHPAGLQFF